MKRGTGTPNSEKKHTDKLMLPIVNNKDSQKAIIKIVLFRISMIELWREFRNLYRMSVKPIV